MRLAEQPNGSARAGTRQFRTNVNLLIKPQLNSWNSFFQKLSTSELFGAIIGLVNKSFWPPPASCFLNVRMNSRFIRTLILFWNSVECVQCHVRTWTYDIQVTKKAPTVPVSTRFGRSPRTGLAQVTHGCPRPSPLVITVRLFFVNLAPIAAKFLTVWGSGLPTA